MNLRKTQKIRQTVANKQPAASTEISQNEAFEIDDIRGDSRLIRSALRPY